MINRTQPSILRRLECAALGFFLAIGLAACSTPQPVDLNARLAAAVTQGNVVLARQLIAQGANVDAVTANGRTLLVAALYQHLPAMVDLLLAQGAAINRQAPNRMTPVLQAAASDAYSTLLELLQAGADPRAGGDSDLRLLYYMQLPGGMEPLDLTPEVRRQRAAVWAWLEARHLDTRYVPKGSAQKVAL